MECGGGLYEGEETIGEVEGGEVVGLPLGFETVHREGERGGHDLELNGMLARELSLEDVL